MPRVLKTIKTKSVAEPVAPLKSRAAQSVPPEQPVSRTLPVIVVLSVLLLLALTIAGYFYYQYKHTPEVANAEEVAKVVKTVGAMLELPTNETPTLATVSDKSKLENQPFFKNAANGDKVLIYADSGRAILYRPSSKKIIDITVIDLKSQTNKKNMEETPVAPSLPTPPVTAAPVDTAPSVVIPVAPTVALYNGSQKIGVTGSVQADIVSAFPDVVIATKDKAAKNDYTGNMVVDLSGKNSDLASKLAKSMDGTVATLPAGEVAPATDLLVIVGNK